jgi:hypothetical protein
VKLASFNTICDEPLTNPAGFPTIFANVGAPAATDALIDVAIEPLNVEYPVVDEIVICDEPLTTVSVSNLVLIVVLIEEVNKFKLDVLSSILLNLVNVDELNVLTDAVDAANWSILVVC